MDEEEEKEQKGGGGEEEGAAGVGGGGGGGEGRNEVALSPCVLIVCSCWSSIAVASPAQHGFVGRQHFRWRV